MEMERDSLHVEEYQENAAKDDFEDSYAEDYGVDTGSAAEPEEDEYDDEPEAEEEAQEADGEAEEPDEVGYLDDVFDYLVDALQNGRTVPMSKNKLVDTEKCLTMLEEIRANLPEALDQAIRIQREKKRILNAAERIAKEKFDKANAQANEIIDEAEEHADHIEEAAQRKADAIVAGANDRARRILEDAERRAEKMTNESEVMIIAKREAASLRENARAEAHETRLKAVNDAWRLFDALEKQTNGISEALRARKNEMNGKA